MRVLSKAFIGIHRIKYIEKYMYCMKAGLQEGLTYRFQYCMGLVILLIPFAIKNCIWLFAFEGSKEIAGYTVETMLLYNCMMLIVGSLTGTNVNWEIADEIKTGDLSKYLTKPVVHRKYWFSKWTGNRVGQTIYAFGIFLTVFIVCPGGFGTIKCENIAAGLTAFGFAYILNFLIFYNISLLSFRFLEISSFFAAFDLILSFLNGEYLPIDLMPEAWIRICRFLPVSSGAYFVVRTIMGAYSWREFLTKSCIQLSWILLLTFCASYRWKKGIKRYESVGV